MTAFIVPPDLAETAQAIMDGKPLGLTDAQAAVWNNAKENRKRRLQGAPQTDPRLKQTSFFNVPAPPVPIAWDIQWRWNKQRLRARIEERYPDDLPSEIDFELDAFAGDNAWQRHRNPKFHSINNRGYAHSYIQQLADDFPGKEFRVECVKWREVTEPTML